MRRSSKAFSFKELFRSFWPLFALTAFLPIIFFGVQSGPSPLFSRADSPNSIRLWMEPTSVITSPGQPVSVTLMAELDKTGSLLPSLSVAVTGDSELQIDPSTITYSKPFGGRITLGTVTVQANQQGTYLLQIPKELIQTGAISIDSIETGKAKIVVR